MILAGLKRHWPALAVVLLTGAIFGAGSRWGAHQSNIAWALKWQQRDADDATALAERQASARTEEQRRQGEIDAIKKKVGLQIAEAAADADRARAVSDRLHREAEKFAARLAERERACRAGTPERGQAETGGAVLLADLFRRADERAGELAREADEARARGAACAAAYDSIIRGDHAEN